MAGLAVPLYRAQWRGLATVRRAPAVALCSASVVSPASFSSAAAPFRKPRLGGECRGKKRPSGPVLAARGFKSDVGVPADSREPPAFAFAFDIDGVLLHVSKPIPGATEVLNFLNEYNIPFILLTNGGGKHETERVEDLASKLGVPLSTDNFVQSHTPFRELLDGPDGLRDKTVLVTGSDYEKCRAVFKEYGFRNVVTPADIFAADPTIFPFQPVSTFTEPSQPLPKPLFNERTASTPHPSAAEHLKIDAIFVLNDPRDWALDTQIITDLLLSSQGFLGTYSRHNNNNNHDNHQQAGREKEGGGGWQRDGQPRLYFSNADLFWSANYPLPRLGQGAFQAALAGLWARITGGCSSSSNKDGPEMVELRRTSIGKPYGATYRFAERVLARHRGEVLASMGKGTGKGKGEGKGSVGDLKTVYMVGDNPESDIAGANGHVSADGAEWMSVLVKTGVWSEERGVKLEGSLRPRVVVDDVKAAVKWALRREGWHQGERGEKLE